MTTATSSPMIAPPLADGIALPPTTWWGLCARAAADIDRWAVRHVSPAVVKDESGDICLTRVLWFVADPQLTTSWQVSAAGEVGLMVARALARLQVAAVRDDLCRWERGRTAAELALLLRTAARYS